jgi:hypothetical protein
MPQLTLLSGECSVQSSGDVTYSFWISLIAFGMKILALIDRVRLIRHQKELTEKNIIVSMI